MAFADNNNALYESKIQTDENMEIVFSMLENKRSGMIRGNSREFKHTEGYDGPTKNGMMLKFNTLEDVEKYQKAFNDFFEEAKKFY